MKDLSTLFCIVGKVRFFLRFYLYLMHQREDVELLTEQTPKPVIFLCSDGLAILGNCSSNLFALHIILIYIPNPGLRFAFF